MNHKKILQLFYFIAISIFLCGCVSDPDYSFTAENVALLKKCNMCHKLNIGQFSSLQKSPIICRNSGTIGPSPQDDAFSELIRVNLIQELREADLYSKEAPVTLHGTLNEIALTTTANKAQWKFDMTFKDGRSAPFRVAEEFNFSTSSNSERACEHAVKELEPSIGKFLKKVYESHEFQKVLR